MHDIYTYFLGVGGRLMN